MNIAIFASGNGENFQKLAQNILSGKISAHLSFLFCDKRGAHALKRAENLGILSFSFELREFPGKVAYEEKIIELLKEYHVDLVLLAGYMKIIGETLLVKYAGRVINIHPAFLPEFKGAHAVREAWEAKVSSSGVTIHYVDSGVDTGKIIKQERVPIFPKDSMETFEERIHRTEHRLYSEVLKELVERGLNT